MNDELSPSDGMAPAADEEDDADHCASNIVTNAPLSIEPQSIAKEATLNTHPLLSCNSTFEGFEAIYPNGEMICTLAMKQQLLEAMQPLEFPTPRKKKLIHRAMKVGVAMIPQTRDRTINGHAVGNCVSNFQPLEFKYQAGDIETSTAKNLETLGKDQSHGNEDGCLMDTPADIIDSCHLLRRQQHQPNVLMVIIK
jgi:hypothetical protein